MAGEQSRRFASVLFTAFEPSGDAHAAPVIEELSRRVPDLKIYAWGGPKMEAAGATLLGSSADDGSMGLNALKKASTVRGYVRSIKAWAKEYRILAHVAVDSPAANFPIAKAMKRSGARVIHLVAPQLWAWGAWRAGKLRRTTDLVICLLPFEQQFFTDRKIPARFVGHPRINRDLDLEELTPIANDYPQGTPKVALFPGSRTHEVKANIGLLTKTFNELQGRHAGMSGLIVAANPELAKLIRQRIKVFPVGLHMATAQPDAAILWCDLAIAVSGTISMDILRQRKPMIGVYRTGLLSWLLSKVLLRTPYRLLPNIIAESEVCPEFIPHVGGAGPIIEEAAQLLRDSKNSAIQTEKLSRVAQRFSGKRPEEESAKLIIKVLRDGVVD